jgi:hypothetical protein
MVGGSAEKGGDDGEKLRPLRTRHRMHEHREGRRGNEKLTGHDGREGRGLAGAEVALDGGEIDSGRVDDVPKPRRGMSVAGEFARCGIGQPEDRFTIAAAPPGMAQLGLDSKMLF